MNAQQILEETVTAVSSVDDYRARPDRCQVVLSDLLLDSYSKSDDRSVANTLFQFIKDVGTPKCPMGKYDCPLSSYACPVVRQASCESVRLI